MENQLNESTLILKEQNVELINQTNEFNEASTKKFICLQTNNQKSRKRKTCDLTEKEDNLKSILISNQNKRICQNFISDGACVARCFVDGLRGADEFDQIAALEPTRRQS